MNFASPTGAKATGRPFLWRGLLAQQLMKESLMLPSKPQLTVTEPGCKRRMGPTPPFPEHDTSFAMYHRYFPHMCGACDIDVVAFLQASAESTRGPSGGQSGILETPPTLGQLSSPQGSVFPSFSLQFGYINGISEHCLENLKSPEAHRPHSVFWETVFLVKCLFSFLM